MFASWFVKQDFKPNFYMVWEPFRNIIANKWKLKKKKSPDEKWKQ